MGLADYLKGKGDQRICDRVLTNWSSQTTINAEIQKSIEELEVIMGQWINSNWIN